VATSSRALLVLGLLASMGWLGVTWAQREGSAVPALALYAVAAGLVILLRARRQLGPLLRLSLRGSVLGLGVGAAMTAATYLGYPMVAALEPAVAAEVRGLYQQLELGDPATALPLVCIVVAGEELVWRGALLEGLAPGRRWSSRELGKVALASAAYAVAQAGFGSALLVAVALPCGAVWAALRLHTRELGAPLLSHLVWSSFVLWLVPLQP
jgi:membrane protease YdiL (CAAX protease family)